MTNLQRSKYACTYCLYVLYTVYVRFVRNVRTYSTYCAAPSIDSALSFPIFFSPFVLSTTRHFIFFIFQFLLLFFSFRFMLLKCIFYYSTFHTFVFSTSYDFTPSLPSSYFPPFLLILLYISLFHFLFFPPPFIFSPPSFFFSFLLLFSFLSFSFFFLSSFFFLFFPSKVLSCQLLFISFPLFTIDYFRRFSPLIFYLRLKSFFLYFFYSF